MFSHERVDAVELLHVMSTYPDDNHDLGCPVNMDLTYRVISR